MYVCTPTFISVHDFEHAYTHIYTHFFPMIIILFFIILYCLKTYCNKSDLYFFVLGRDRFIPNYICFKQTLFSNFSYNLFKGYLHYKTMTSQNVPSEAHVQNCFVS